MNESIAAQEELSLLGVMGGAPLPRNHPLQENTILFPFGLLAFILFLLKRRRVSRLIVSFLYWLINVWWKRKGRLSWLGAQPITKYSVIKEKEFLFLYGGSNQQFNLFPFHQTQTKEIKFLFFYLIPWNSIELNGRKWKKYYNSNS